MNDKKAKNIFEAVKNSATSLVSKSHGSGPEKKEVIPAEEVNFLKTDEILQLHGDAEINEMLNKMYRMQEDIQSKMHEMYGNAGLSTHQVRNYLDNPSNFSPEMWQKIQVQRDQLEKKVNDVLKIYAKKAKTFQTGHMLKASEIAKERKAKTLAARKNWIPM
ncbi:hypothetical protein [Neochlamydia sp. S13]|uniref:hypothetical protein n=1 Tax=Neochlamydia sp. S13 TaxID=1353976 RepID=UPI0005A62E1E|nr:hypothetical protein [Neochlamydia sp. S13]BBI17994.1 hypothetical protein NCS13_1_1799 [Neochlamydia sp. S13]